MARKKAVGTDYIPDYNYTTPVPSQKVRTSSKKSFWLFKVSPVISIIFVLFLIAMSLVVQHAWLNYLGFRITQLNNEITNLQEMNEKLKLQISAEASLEKIEEIALNQLGMIDPENVYYIYSSTNLDTKEEQVEVQIAGFIPESQQGKEDKENVSANTWLGTIEDFFRYYLKEKS